MDHLDRDKGSSFPHVLTLLTTGNLDVKRDFGFAGDYVQCMYMMMQSDVPDDYVIATGESHSIREFCKIAFARAGADWRDHVTVDDTLIRKVDSYHTTGDASKVLARLGWRPTTSFTELIALMVDQQIHLVAARDSNSSCADWSYSRDGRSYWRTEPDMLSGGQCHQCMTRRATDASRGAFGRSDTIVLARRLTMKSSFISVCSASLAALAWAGVSHPATAADDMSFAGKTITMTIGFGAGGGVDLYGRMLGRHLVRHLPGQPALIVLNQLGAGGVVAMNDWSNKAEPNGLSVTIGAQSQTDPDAIIRTHAKYDTTTFNYVGGLAAYSQALFVNQDAVERLYNKSLKPVVMGVVGSTLRSGNYQVLWGAAFLGWNVKWVRGYTRTAELRQAMERGEIDMSTFGASADIQYLLRAGKVAMVSQSGSVKEGKPVPRAVFGDAPIISDLVKGKIKDPLAQKAFSYGELVSQVGMWLALPPRTPDGIVAPYVKAFEATLRDPQYQNEFAKIDPDSPVANKADLEKLIRELAKVSPETLAYLQAELKRQGFGSTN